MEMSTPPTTAADASPRSSRRHSPNMSIDLSDLPPLIQPSPPTNTLLITNLQAPEIFQAANLDSIRLALEQQAPLHNFSPLKALRRIIISLYSTEDAIRVRQLLDGEDVLGCRVRVYFGQATRIETDEERHLKAPKSSKMFFISPPPSPPMGWEMRDEGPPNKEVHAEDLATALSKLHAKPDADAALREKRDVPLKVSTRQRSGTGTVVYDPMEHGHSAELPAIEVEDTSAGPDEVESPMEGVERPILAHTARPPVELME